MRKIIIAILAIGITSCTTTTYYIVRHAEKADVASSDPILSESGNARAAVLRDFLSTKDIDSIFVSHMQRTQLTAAPLVSALGKTPVILPASFKGTQVLIARLKKIDGNKHVLVVGHSNTVPLIIDSLMRGPQGIVIPENDFDNLFAIKVRRGLSIKRKLDKKTYGVTTP